MRDQGGEMDGGRGMKGEEGREKKGGGKRGSEGVYILRWYHFLIQRNGLLQALLSLVQSTNQETEHTIVIPVLRHMICT